MVKLTKEDENKLGQILKELKEVGEMLKGGEGSGVKGHKTEEEYNVGGGGKWYKHLSGKMARISEDGHIDHWNDASARGQPHWHDDHPSPKFAINHLKNRGYKQY